MTTRLLIEPEYASALRQAGLAEFDALMRVPCGPPASRHAHRETVPIEIPVDGRVRRFFLKRVFRVPFEHAFLPCLRLSAPYSQPMREWEMIAELAGAGLPVMRRVAVGERRRCGLPSSALLLVEAVAPRHTLEEWLVPGFPPAGRLSDADRRRLYFGLGELIWRLHIQGFTWPDIHVKHIFAELGRHEGLVAWRFALIDVERMRRGPARLVNDAGLSGLKALNELMRLHDSARPLHVSALDRRAFAAGYAMGPVRKVAGAVDMRRLVAVTGDAPRLPVGYVHPRARGLDSLEGFQASVDTAAALRNAGLDSMDRVFALPCGDELDKPGLDAYRHRARLTLGNGETGGTYYLKRYVQPPLREQIRRMIEARARRGTAWRERHYAKRLAEIGIGTIRVAAFGEEMQGRWERRSFLLTAEVPGESLERLAARALAEPASRPTAREKHAIIRELALVARLMHSHHLYHRDLYLSHVLLSRDSQNRPILHIIDLGRMIEEPARENRWRIKDLAALEYSSPAGLISRADRIRFLRWYYTGTAGPEVEGECRNRMRYDIPRIQARARRMARHDARRGRGALTP